MTLKLDRVEIESVGSDPTQLARAVLEQLPSLSAPIPTYKIASALDIMSIEKRRLHSIEGCLQTDELKSEGIIVVNQNSRPRRRNFTIAHELGHFLNERHWPTQDLTFNCTSQDMSNPQGDAKHLKQEQEANRFAIELLAPEAFFAAAIDQAPDLGTVSNLAERLEISREAGIRRYIELHPDKLAAVFSCDGKIRYVAKCNDFPRLSCWSGNLLPNFTSVHEKTGCSQMDEADPRDWLSHPHGKELFAQTLFQQDGYATTLLVIE